MAKYIRYAIAAVFFAASVGCLGLWWRSFNYHEAFVTSTLNAGEPLCLTTSRGWGNILVMEAVGTYPRWGLPAETAVYGGRSRP
jgi:hypothetical protein